MTSVPDLDALFERLSRSDFRSRFALGPKDRAYLDQRGLAAVADHARDFVARRLAPAAPPNDGKQTPYRGHPVFIAQHAGAACCRSCLAKWHRIPAGRALSEDEQAYVVEVLMRWLETRKAPAEGSTPAASGRAQRGLFP